MALPSHLRVLSVGFMLIVLCMHNCSARKVLMEDMNMQEKGQPKDEVKVKPAPMAKKTDHGLAQKNNDTNMMSKDGEEIGPECFNEGCESQCYELPCNGVVVWPQPPPVVVIIEPPPCRPCEEPWLGPGPCPCPCEEEGYNAETEGLKTEGGAHDNESSNKKAKEGEMEDRPIMGTPALSNGADAPMPAIFHGSNVHA